MIIEKTLAKVFGTANERDLKRMAPIVAGINALEPSIQSLTDDQLRAKTAEFRERCANGEALEDLLPEAFAVVREAGRRTLNMRHFDVQLIGGIVLHRGKIAEMKTGEGKTLVATLPAYLNALAGKGVHVVTVNDYLARRDSEWMGRIYRFLGMSVGVIQHDLNDLERQVAYACDITYGTNNEFGFDYLRDNMKFDLAHYVQRGHHFAIVDEVDSILIDEARTPLIISGPAEQAPDLYYEVDRIIPKLQKGATTRGDVKAEERDELEKTGDYIVDEKHKTVNLTESGMAKAEKLLAHHIVPGSEGLFDPANMPLLHHINQALRAHALFHLDVEYMVKDGEVIIVDEFTGRLMPGRRWSDGLHQAVEAKEHNGQHPEVKIERENQTLATITFQNYFRKYAKLSGMTGTADTEAQEFASTYKIDVMVIPTNRVLRRLEEPDTVYRTEREKYDAIVNDILEKQKVGRPVLVGTVSIEKSEKLSRLLKLRGIKHVVLNAKYHAQEAEIVAQAGRKGTVTIATNMAGRGTDILLGGNPEFMTREFLKEQEVDPDEATESQWQQEFLKAKRIVEAEHQEVVSLGGLHILGTERHESRRIDNQLRGRAGRQGDPGSSRFFLSLEDDLMRIFAGDKVKALMARLGMEEGVAIESKMVSKRIAAAQKSVEGRNFETRKHLLEYDDVMNKQRETIYGLRRQLMEEPDQREYLLGETGVARDLLGDLTRQYLDPNAPPDAWDVENYKVQIQTIYALDPEAEGIDFQRSSSEEIDEFIWEKLKVKYAEKEKQIGDEAMRTYERIIMLNIIDAQWKDHLLALDHLKQGIGLVGYGQKDPLVEYKKESFDMFQAMLDRIDTTTIRSLFNLQVVAEESPEEIQRRRLAARRRGGMQFTGPNQGAAAAGEEAGKVKTVIRDQPKVGRNDPCPCGSGKKYKKCHGAMV
jgi:preprotein translocase subunit SecA